MKRTTYIQGFRLYPFSVAGHIFQGAAAVFAIVFGGLVGIVLGCVLTVLYIAYQGLSVLRKEDSPGLDIADYMTGAALGVVCSLAWIFVIV